MDSATDFQQRLQEILQSAGSGTLDEVRVLLASMRPPELANVISSAPSGVRLVLWELLDDEEENALLQYLGEDVRAELLETLSPEQLIAAAEALDTDDFADVLQQLPTQLTEQVLASLDASDRARLEAVLSYPEDCAGGLMNTDLLTVRPRHTIELVLRYLRLRKDMPRTTDALWVVNEKDEFVGALPIAKLLTTDPSVIVREVMDSDVNAINVMAPDTDVARQFSELDLVTAPVVNDDGLLLGRITIDDVVDVIIEDAGEAVMMPAGLDSEEDTFAPVMKAFRGRLLWLSINLATAFIAAAVINIFEDTIAKVVALAVLMPIVASMGGIAGTQTLTLVIRGIALGHIGRANLRYLLNHEFWISAINGVVLAVIVASVASLAFQDLTLGAVIAAAMVVNLVTAAVSGVFLPPLLQKLGIDPALAGGVILTTITDVMGFFSFLGLATWAYA